MHRKFAHHEFEWNDGKGIYELIDLADRIYAMAFFLSFAKDDPCELGIEAGFMGSQIEEVAMELKNNLELVGDALVEARQKAEAKKAK